METQRMVQSMLQAKLEEVDSNDSTLYFLNYLEGKE